MADYYYTLWLLRKAFFNNIYIARQIMDRKMDLEAEEQLEFWKDRMDRVNQEFREKFAPFWCETHQNFETRRKDGSHPLCTVGVLNHREAKSLCSWYPSFNTSTRGWNIPSDFWHQHSWECGQFKNPATTSLLKMNSVRRVTYLEPSQTEDGETKLYSQPIAELPENYIHAHLYPPGYCEYPDPGEILDMRPWKRPKTIPCVYSMEGSGTSGLSVGSVLID